MTGINYIVDKKGTKTAVVIDIKRYGKLWEDFFDSAIARIREDEPRYTLENVKGRLRKQGKLRD